MLTENIDCIAVINYMTTLIADFSVIVFKHTDKFRFSRFDSFSHSCLPVSVEVTFILNVEERTETSYVVSLPFFTEF